MTKIVQLLVLVVSVVLWAPRAATADAKTRAKIIAVVNRADWCSVCKANGERVGKLLVAAARDGTVSIVMNDLTDEATTKKSHAMLEQAGIAAAMTPYTAVGVIYFFDGKTKRALHQVTAANTDDEIGMSIGMSKKEATP